MSGAAHVAAVVDLLESSAFFTAITVHEGKAPNNTVPPYVVIWPPAPLRHRGERHDAARMANVHTAIEMEIPMLAVGATSKHASEIADLVADVLAGAVLDVTGRRCWPIVQTYSPPVDLESRDPDLYVAKSGWRIRSVPE